MIKELFKKLTTKGFGDMYSNDITRKKVAFTLAEVLITLAIIGVVAAMTIPALFHKIQEVQTVNKCKRNVETFIHAYRLVISEVGSSKFLYDSSKSDLENAEILFDEMAKHMKVAKKCKTGNKECFPKAVKMLDGRDINPRYWYDYENIIQGMLVTGESFWISNYATDTELLFDINGGNKGENKLGVDQFKMYLSDTGYPKNLGLEFINKRNSCNKNRKVINFNGYGCLEIILKTGKMDYYFKN